MTTRVTEIPPVSPAIAADYFESQMKLTTDCWDVHESMAGEMRISCCLTCAAVRLSAPVMWPGSVSLPHAEIAAAEMGKYPPDTVFVVYCAGPHCNGAYRAAIRLAHLGRPVKMMIGGVAGWLDEGFVFGAQLRPIAGVPSGGSLC